MAGTGFLGGTFDPPHLGHLVFAETALEVLKLDQVVLIPVGRPPHKETMTADHHRLAMTRLALLGNERLSVDSIDIERHPPHYTVDLVPLLAKRWPNQRLMLLLGGDSIVDLPTWHKPQRLVRSISVAGLNRPGFTIDWQALEKIIPGLQAAVTMIDGPSLHVSSTALRAGLATGRRFRYLIPAGVREYISRYQLYSGQQAVA